MCQAHSFQLSCVFNIGPRATIIPISHTMRWGPREVMELAGDPLNSRNLNLGCLTLRLSVLAAVDNCL